MDLGIKNEPEADVARVLGHNVMTRWVIFFFFPVHGLCILIRFFFFFFFLVTKM